MSAGLAQRWLMLDLEHARDAQEQTALRASAPLREAIVELWRSAGEGAHGDLLSAFAQLARALCADGLSGGSAMSCARSFVTAVPEANALLDPLLQTMVEAYLHAQLEAQEHRVRARFERAWTRLGEAAVVIADPPDDDEEWLRAWADKLALAVMRSGAKRCLLSCNAAAEAVLREALDLVGVIPLTDPSLLLPQPAAKRRRFSWLRP